MAVSKIEMPIKYKDYQFDNLAQYVNTSFYSYIPDYKTIAGIPSESAVISAQLMDWSTLGDGNVSLAIDGTRMYVLHVSNVSVTAQSYAKVRFAYI